MIRRRPEYVSGDESHPIQGGEMKDLTRRRFLTHSSIGVVFAGAFALVPAMSAAMKVTSGASKKGVRTGIASGPFVAHVRDLATGEIAFLVGTERFIVHDRELAGRLHSAALSR
jgi:hypothetical protein